MNSARHRDQLGDENEFVDKDDQEEAEQQSNCDQTRRHFGSMPQGPTDCQVPAKRIGI